MNKILTHYRYNENMTTHVLEKLEIIRSVEPLHVESGRFVIGVYDNIYHDYHYMISIMDMIGGEIHVPIILDEIEVTDRDGDYIAHYIDGVIRLELKLNGVVQ